MGGERGPEPVCFFVGGVWCVCCWGGDLVGWIGERVYICVDGLVIFVGGVVVCSLWGDWKGGLVNAYTWV